MGATLYIAAGPVALKTAKDFAHLSEMRGDKSVKYILEHTMPVAKTLREQEALAVTAQPVLLQKLQERFVVGDVTDVSVFVEFGSTAGGLLAMIETVKVATLDKGDIRTGGVIVLAPIAERQAVIMTAEVEVLGRALWQYTLDGRLHWSMVVDSSLAATVQTQEDAVVVKKFGSRLYGE